MRFFFLTLLFKTAIYPCPGLASLPILKIKLWTMAFIAHEMGLTKGVLPWMATQVAFIKTTLVSGEHCLDGAGLAMGDQAGV